MFGINTQEKIPDILLTDLTAWDEYMGQVWYSILSFANFTKESSVVDIAPGSSIKLGAALAKADYQGHLYVIDSSTEALEALKKKYVPLLPRAQIHWLCGPLREQVTHLPRHPDYVLGNHILDDMLLSAADAPQEQENNFAWASAYEHKPATRYQKNWERILTEPASLSRGKKDVEDDIATIVKSLAPRCLILNQYPSSTLYDHGLSAVNDQAFSILTALKELLNEGLTGQQHLQTVLNTHRNFGNEHIGEHILNAKYWMLWHPKKT
jgi:hypothetical protein